MRYTLKIGDYNSHGQSAIQLIIPLIIILFVLLGLALMIPKLSPIKTFALVAGMVIFITSFISTTFALYILIFSMLLSPEFIVGATGATSLGRGVTLRLDDFILAIIGFSWLAKMSINKELGLFLRTPLNRPIAYYIIICLVSTLIGAIFGRLQLKTGFFYLLKYFEYMIVYFMVVNHIENKKQVRNYMWALLITCMIVSVIGITQIPGGGRVTAPFEGAQGEPNTFGGYLILMISVVIGLFLTTPSFRNQLLYFFFILLFTIPMFYTQSRSSYLAIVPALLTFIFLSEKRVWVIVVLLLIGTSLPFTAPKPAKERIVYTFTQGRDRMDVFEFGGIKLDTSLSARVKSWEWASKDWIKHPFVGFGVTGYRFVDAQYVRVITETGFLGLILFLILIYAIFRQTYTVFKKTTESFDRGLSMGFLAGFIGLLFHAIGANTFIIVRIMEPFWFMAALVLMIPEIKDEEAV